MAITSERYTLVASRRRRQELKRAAEYKRQEEDFKELHFPELTKPGDVKVNNMNYSAIVQEVETSEKTIIVNPGWVKLSRNAENKTAAVYGGSDEHESNYNYMVGLETKRHAEDALKEIMRRHEEYANKDREDFFLDYKNSWDSDTEYEDEISDGFSSQSSLEEDEEEQDDDWPM